METNSNSGRVPFISKFAYGMGDVGCNFSWMFVSNFLMIFYTDVFGIGMSAVATLMLVSRIWDAVNDPIIGTLTDKTHTRWGRFRPWLLFGAPVTAIILMLTFWAHPSWSQTAKIVYMSITYCVLVLGYTCVNLPYGTLCGAMTQNIDERAKLNTSRSVSAMIAIGVLNIIHRSARYILRKRKRTSRLSYCGNYLRTYIRGVSSFLLQQNSRSGRSSGGQEDATLNTTEIRFEKPPVYSGTHGTVSFRIHSLRTQCRHSILLYLCGRFGNALFLLFNGYNSSFNSRCGMLSLDFQENGEQGICRRRFRSVHGRFHGSALLFQSQYNPCGVLRMLCSCVVFLFRFQHSHICRYSRLR